MSNWSSPHEPAAQPMLLQIGHDPWRPRCPARHRSGNPRSHIPPGLPCQGCTQPRRSELRMLESWEVFWPYAKRGTTAMHKTVKQKFKLRELEPKSPCRDAPATINTHHIYPEHSQQRAIGGDVVSEAFSCHSLTLYFSDSHLWTIKWPFPPVTSTQTAT